MRSNTRVLELGCGTGRVAATHWSVYPPQQPFNQPKEGTVFLMYSLRYGRQREGTEVDATTGIAQSPGAEPLACRETLQCHHLRQL
jgi:hypothetical protein